MGRTARGSLIGIVSAVALAGAMIPLRSHISTATAGLVLVVPVVAGVGTGGFVAGLVSVGAGFLVFDFALIPPYYTLEVGAGQNWAVLGVYVVVMALVARVVSSLDEARAASESRRANARRLFDVSEMLLADRPVDQLAKVIVGSVRNAFGIGGVALLLSVDGNLEVAAASGDRIEDSALASLRPDARIPVALTNEQSSEEVQTLALATSARPVGLLVLRDVPAVHAVRELLPTLANHLALAIERAQLHDRVREAELTEEVDRLRHALVGAVSHDLRTPLATIKVASSTLLDPDNDLSTADLQELHSLIDAQTDRLTRIVNNVLDMTRIRAGVLEPKLEPWSTLDLVSEAVSGLQSSLDNRVVEVEIPAALPMVEVDHQLIEQVIANIVDNANRHGAPGTPITIQAAHGTGQRVEVSVIDSGSGVPPREREAIFDTFVRFDTGGRAGLGLAIAKEFVEAHGERIWVDEAPGRGARFVFTLPIARANGAA